MEHGTAGGRLPGWLRPLLTSAKGSEPRHVFRPVAVFLWPHPVGCCSYHRGAPARSGAWGRRAAGGGGPGGLEGGGFGGFAGCMSATCPNMAGRLASDPNHPTPTQRTLAPCDPHEAADASSTSSVRMTSSWRSRPKATIKEDARVGWNPFNSWLKAMAIK